jgi:hypothetical protein
MNDQLRGRGFNIQGGAQRLLLRLPP